MTGHLIHIGYPKTGSNLLRRWFSVHRQLSYVEGGIAGFGSVHEVAREAAAPRDGVRYRVTSSEALATPQPPPGAGDGGMRDPFSLQRAQGQACRMLATLFPGSRILIVTRGFRSMILSSYSQYVRAGGEQSLQMLIDDACAERAWDYDWLIGQYAALFGETNVHVLPYELLRDSIDDFVRALEDRLGLDHCPAPRDRLNAALSPAELQWYPRITRFLQRLPLGARLRRSYVRATMRNRLRGPIRVLQWLRPEALMTAETIPDDALHKFRGSAERLRTHPLYAPYGDDYLF